MPRRVVIALLLAGCGTAEPETAPAVTEPVTDTPTDAQVGAPLPPGCAWPTGRPVYALATGDCGELLAWSTLADMPCRYTQGPAGCDVRIACSGGLALDLALPSGGPARGTATLTRPASQLDVACAGAYTVEVAP